MFGAEGEHAQEAEYTNADGLPFSFGDLCPSKDGTLYLLGASPELPGGVYQWDGLKSGAKAAKEPATMLACSMKVRKILTTSSLPQLSEQSIH